MTKSPTTTYTVFHSHEGNVVGTGMSLESAAIEILWYDNKHSEIRRDTRGFQLWCQVHGGGGNHPLVETVIFSLETKRAAALIDIYQQVIKFENWASIEAMPDDLYADQQAEIARENGEN